jgi:hypothetical protein
MMSEQARRQVETTGGYITPHANGSNAPFPCPQCWKGFETERLLTKHLEAHRLGRRYNCPVTGCARMFVSAEMAKRHLFTHMDYARKEWEREQKRKARELARRKPKGRGASGGRPAKLARGHRSFDVSTATAEAAMRAARTVKGVDAFANAAAAALAGAKRGRPKGSTAANSRGSLTKRQLLERLGVDASDADYECTLDPGVCSERFKQSKALYEHMVSVHNLPDERVSCPLADGCGGKFFVLPARATWIKHILTAHFTRSFYVSTVNGVIVETPVNEEEDEDEDDEKNKRQRANKRVECRVCAALGAGPVNGRAVFPRMRPDCYAHLLSAHRDLAFQVLQTQSLVNVPLSSRLG